MKRPYDSLRAATVNDVDRRLRLVMLGLPSDGGHVRVSDFLKEIQLFYRSLRSIDRSLSPARDLATEYRITDLRHSSPAVVEVEAVPRHIDEDRSQRVVGSFIALLYSIDRETLPAAGVDLSALRAVRGMTEAVGKTLLGLEVHGNGFGFELNREFQRKIAVFTKRDEEYEGTIRGVIEAINVHDEANEFRIYPDVGPRKVLCHFPADLKSDALSAVGRFVHLTGLLKRKLSAKYPHEMKVVKLSVSPPDDELPELLDIRGIAPGITGDLTSVEFVRRLRDGAT